MELHACRLQKTLEDRQGFNGAAPGYDAARRKLVPCFDKFYGWPVRLLPFSGAYPVRVLDLGAGTNEGRVAVYSVRKPS